jgi:YesN/AraC family two-component response regulator
MDFNKEITLLYVEDQEEVREELSDVLALFVEHLYTAKDGEEALLCYQAHRIDMVITDINMPKMSGIELVKAIRANNSETPIIMSTAFSDSKYLFEAIELGVSDYIVKPVQITKLETTIQKLRQTIYEKRELESYHTHLEQRVEDALNSAKHQSLILTKQNKIAEIGAMAGVITHQWKQPLNILSMLVQDVRQAFNVNECNEEYLKDFENKSLENIRFMDETVHNLLSFYKNEAKQENFSIQKSITSMIFLFEATYKVKGIHFHLNNIEDFTLYGVENAFKQVFLNIISNAKDAIVDAQIEDGVIDITINQHRVEIYNTGPQIPDEILTTLFNAEFTTKESGNGIGLYLCKTLLNEKFNAEITVQNEPKGVRFMLDFNQ